MTKTILHIDNVSKLYRLGQVGTGTLAHDLNRWWAKVRGKEDPFLKIGETNRQDVHGQSEYVWALKDINLEVKQGEVLGIIGKNGAGKSTLLKILARVTGPTTGQVKIKGRIGSLLEVGTGFHPELTGRENIFLNGAILGMTQAEVRAKFDAIVDFAGIERYIDTPVKRYSSGMYVRLAFAVAAFLEPEILIVDEVLAVGDAEFQKRAIGKMQDVSKGEGRTVLFVSHNMAAVSQLCTRAALLENGKIAIQDKVEAVISKYLDGQNTASFFLREDDDEIGRDALFKEIRVIDQNGKDKTDFLLEEPVFIKFNFKINRNKEKFNLFCIVQDKRLNRVFAAESETIDDEIILKINPFFLTRGSYSIYAFINIPRHKQEDVVENVCHFRIIDNNSFLSKHGDFDYGSVLGSFEWINKSVQEF